GISTSVRTTRRSSELSRTCGGGTNRGTPANMPQQPTNRDQRNCESRSPRARLAAERQRRWPDMDSARSPGDFVTALQERRRLRPDGWTTLEDLDDIDRALATHPASVELWVLRGDFIQLLGDAVLGPPIEEALRSYKRAADLGPTRPEPQLMIGHFMDSV